MIAGTALGATRIGEQGRVGRVHIVSIMAINGIMDAIHIETITDGMDTMTRSGGQAMVGIRAGRCRLIMDGEIITETVGMVDGEAIRPRWFM